MKKDKWIPVSEKLPKKENEYYLCQIGNRNMMILSYAEGFNCFRDFTGQLHNEYEMNTVVAWMPLPEPYKGRNK